MLADEKKWILLIMRYPLHQTGFSLIELMISIVIVGLFAALGIPSFNIWLANSRIRNAAESIVSGLQVARNEAVRRNASVQFVLGTGSSWATSCVVATPGCPTTDPIQSRATGEGSNNDVSVTPSDDPTVVFNNFGMMVLPVPGAGASVSFAVDISSIPASESRDLRITIDTGGNIRLCDPNTVAPDPRAC